MPHTFSNLLVHVVFSTKDRIPSLDTQLKTRLFPYLGGIARNLDATLLCVNGPSDHIHVLLALPADVSVAEVVRVLKANSSKWIHQNFPSHSRFAWQVGYSAFSVSRSGVKAVRAYIEIQEEHHKRVTFADEIRMFLKKHGMETGFDQYLE